MRCARRAVSPYEKYGCGFVHQTISLLCKGTLKMLLMVSTVFSSRHHKFLVPSLSMCLWYGGTHLFGHFHLVEYFDMAFMSCCIILEIVLHDNIIHLIYSFHPKNAIYINTLCSFFSRCNQITPKVFCQFLYRCITNVISFLFMSFQVCNLWICFYAPW